MPTLFKFSAKKHSLTQVGAEYILLLNKCGKNEFYLFK